MQEKVLNNLKIQNEMFLKSKMAKYIRGTIKEYESYDDIINKLSSLDIPLSQEVNMNK